MLKRLSKGKLATRSRKKIVRLIASTTLKPDECTASMVNNSGQVSEFGELSA